MGKWRPLGLGEGWSDYFPADLETSSGAGGWDRVSVGPLTAALVWWNGSSMALDIPLHENCLPVDAGFVGTLGTMTQAYYLRPGVVTPSLHGTTRVMTF